MRAFLNYCNASAFRNCLVSSLRTQRLQSGVQSATGIHTAVPVHVLEWRTIKCQTLLLPGGDSECAIDVAGGLKTVFVLSKFRSSFPDSSFFFAESGTWSRTISGQLLGLRATADTFNSFNV
jgi:hypothetical protein